jgi:hypothetical protein
MGSMRHVFVLTAILLAAATTVPAQPQPVLHCYGAETQIGVVARREFFDDRGLVVKEIFYRSNDRTGQRTCADDMLRVYTIRNITRDALGRSVAETELSADGEVERVLRHEYPGDSTEASRDIWSAPDGTRRYEIRHLQDGRTAHLYYDAKGLVAGVMGPLPTDVGYALRWGTEVDGWSCGIAVANGSVYVHLKNGTQKETSATFVDWFATELHDMHGSLVPPLRAFAAAREAKAATRGTGRLIRPLEAANYAYGLEERYGRLAPGHYALVVWHPHPITGVMLRSNTFEFDVR